jgi:hypothetical protein
MTKTIIRLDNGSVVETTDEIDFDLLKNLLQNKTKCFFQLSSDNGLTAQSGNAIIIGIEQIRNHDHQRSL